MGLFNIVGESFFKPFSSSYKEVYLDCLNIIYECCKYQMSNSEEKSIVVERLSDYFEERNQKNFVFEEEGEENFADGRSVALEFIRKLKGFGWIDEEIGKNYISRIYFNDYAITILESFRKIVSEEEAEYQSIIQTIYSIAVNEDAYRQKPYENVLIGLQENIERLIKELKKLNTSIKKYIDKATENKDAAEIIEDYFTYHKEIGSKAYHRLKTSDNISRYRPQILDRLSRFTEDEDILSRTIRGYMEIQNEEDPAKAASEIKGMVHYLKGELKNYDVIIEEIENKNVRYINSAIERAKFLLSTDKNIEGKLNKILEMYVHKWNTGKEEMQEEEEAFLHIFDIFQSGFLDGESFYTPRESKGENNGEEFSEECFDDSELAKQREQMDQKLKALVTQKSICEYVDTVLSDKGMMLGSAFPLSTNEDFVKLIFVRFFAGKKGTGYRVEPTGKMIQVNGFRFADFRIVM